jgi:hypothetical protein
VNRRQGRQRALSGIARDLADSDPRLSELFLSFNARAGGGDMPGTEKIRTGLLGLLARLGRRMRPAPYDLDHPAAWGYDSWWLRLMPSVGWSVPTAWPWRCG